MLLSISRAATILGACTKTLRRWHTKGVLIPDCRTIGGHRRYSIESLELFLNKRLKIKKKKRKSKSLKKFQAYWTAAIYGRVSAVKQKEDLRRQLDYLTMKAQGAGFGTVLIYKDIASGLNDKRGGLKRLIKDAFSRKFTTIYITHKDRLARFGTSIIYQVFMLLNVEIYDLDANTTKNNGKNSLSDELIQDVLAVLQKKLDKTRNWKQQLKLRSEISLGHRRRSHLRQEALIKTRIQLGRKLTELGVKYVGLEGNLEKDSKDKKGGLAKAISSMPDNIKLVSRELLAFNSFFNTEIKLILVRKEGTSMFHHHCGGVISRNGDLGTCRKCGELVNTHENSAANIEERAEIILKEFNTKAIPGRTPSAS